MLVTSVFFLSYFVDDVLHISSTNCHLFNEISCFAPSCCCLNLIYTYVCMYNIYIYLYNICKYIYTVYTYIHMHIYMYIALNHFHYAMPFGPTFSEKWCWDGGCNWWFGLSLYPELCPHPSGCPQSSWKQKLPLLHFYQVKLCWSAPREIETWAGARWAIHTLYLYSWAHQGWVEQKLKYFFSALTGI